MTLTTSERRKSSKPSALSPTNSKTASDTLALIAAGGVLAVMNALFNATPKALRKTRRNLGRLERHYAKIEKALGHTCAWCDCNKHEQCDGKSYMENDVAPCNCKDPSHRR